MGWAQCVAFMLYVLSHWTYSKSAGMRRGKTRITYVFGVGWCIVMLFGGFGCGLVLFVARVRRGIRRCVGWMRWGIGCGEWVFMYTLRKKEIRRMVYPARGGGRGMLGVGALAGESVTRLGRLDWDLGAC